MKQTFLGLLALVITLGACQNDQKEGGLLVPLTVVEDNSLSSIEINGVQLHSESFGNPNDPLLLVLHGGPGADYRSLLNFKELADEDLYVVFYDQRGSGLSERLPAESYEKVQVFIDELDGVISHYRNPGQALILAGHSWGAMLATAYINQNPGEVVGAILSEPGGFTWDQTEAYIGRSRQLSLSSESTNDFVYQDQFITGNDHNTLDYKFALSTAGDVGVGDAIAPPYWRYGAICNNSSIQLAISNPEQLNFTSNLSSYNSKILFAYSELNLAYGREHAEEVSSALSNVELVEIPGCGHEIPQFGWNHYYPKIKNYLTEIL